MAFIGPDDTAEYTPLPFNSLAIGAKDLDVAIGGPIDLVAWGQVSNQTRVEIFDGDISTGIDSGSRVLLATPRTGGPSSGTWNAAASEIDFRSARLYDIGRCSSNLFHAIVGPQLLAFVHDALAGLDDEEIAGSQPRIGFNEYRATLRGRGTLDLDEFALHVAARADGFGPQGLHCGGGDYTIDITLSFERRAGRAAPPGVDPMEDAEGDQQPYDLEVIAPAEYDAVDFIATRYSVEVDLVGAGCINELVLTGALEGGLHRLLPYLAAVALRDLLLVDPRDIGFPEEAIRACSVDTDCNYFAEDGPAYPGAGRHRCRSEECWYQLEPERIHARPDSLEIVLVEDEADPLFPYYQQLADPPFAEACSFTRNSRTDTVARSMNSLTLTGL